MIKEIKHINGYRILVEFENGERRLVDLEAFFATATLPRICRFASPDDFKKVHVDYGTLVWGDGECDINPLSIYWGEFEAPDSPYHEQIRQAVAQRDALRKADNMRRAAKRRAAIRRQTRQRGGQD